jgi:hypothetical protein
VGELGSVAVGVLFVMTRRVITIPLRGTEAYLPRQVGLGRWARGLEGDHFGGQTEVREGSSSERPTGSFRSRYAGPRLTWRMAKGSVMAVSRVRWPWQFGQRSTSSLKTRFSSTGQG